MKSTMETLAAAISTLRKQRGLTQEALAQPLGVTFQAVSKWETGVSAPDIQLLPQLAELLGVHIDELFGIPVVTQPHFDLVPDLPWPDDDTLRVVLYHGHKILENAANTVVTFHGDPKNLEVHGNLQCGAVYGNAMAGCDLNCGGDIYGNATAGCDLNCGGNVTGSLAAGCDLNCGAPIHAEGATITVGCDLNCADVNCGHLSVSGDVTCQHITAGQAAIDGGIYQANPSHD